MAYIRTCANSSFNTGVSICDIDYARIKLMILTKHDVKLDYSTGEALRTACHAGTADRAYGFPEILNWEMNGGDAATSTIGYGPVRFTGLNARTDAFTMDFRHYLRAQILKNVNNVFDMYLIDASDQIYGLNDGTEELAGIPVTIYPSGNDHRGASDPATLVVNVVYEDVEDYVRNYDVRQLDYRAKTYVYGLMPVEFVKTDDGYKVVEYYGKADCTAKYGELLADNVSTAFTNVTAATYDANTETMTLTVSEGDPTLATASVLAEAGIYGIEGA